jgi:hypothetical protein
LQVDIHPEVAWIAKGFTGGCLVMVADRDDTVIYDRLIWPLGGDGKAVFWQRSARDDHRRQRALTDALAAATTSPSPALTSPRTGSWTSSTRSGRRPGPSKTPSKKSSESRPLRVADARRSQ